MAKQKTPHKQTQQDTRFAQTDVSPDELEQNPRNASEYENRDGAETGGKRSPRTTPSSAHAHNTESQPVAYEGSLDSRTFDDDTRQGVTTNASSKEAAGQRKVVSEREDAQAGVNHSNKIPPR